MNDIVCVGHNTVDKYISHEMMYPGGNEVNVAVLTSRFGMSSSYVGWVGNDIYGNIIYEALKEENVNVSRCLVKEGKNTFTEIFLENGERRFGKIRRGVGTTREISQADIDFILSHKLLHTGYYSRMEAFMEDYHGLITISYDFSEYADEEYLQKYMKYVDIAFVSNEKIDDLDNIEDTMQKYYSLGPEYIVITMGKLGAYLFNGDLYYTPSVEMDDIIDTLGAGDAFISRFIVEYLNGSTIDQILSRATQSAAETCQYFGAFGHGTSIPE